jgi:hypothetical protein
MGTGNSKPSGVGGPDGMVEKKSLTGRNGIITYVAVRRGKMFSSLL